MTATILDKLADYARERVAIQKQAVSAAEMRRLALAKGKGEFRFERALATPQLSFICECKKASPSKGLIAADFDYLSIARDYERAGADAISVLTEPKWFLGSEKYLEEIAATVSTPCLRKDFTVDEYMIYHARVLGAEAVLLITSLLTDTQLADYIAVADGLGIGALVETHDAAEVERALKAGARIIGVNNRNLKDFTVDNANSERLSALIRGKALFVAESGVQTAGDVLALRRAGADAVLVGEALMKSADKAAKLRELGALL